MKPILFNTEMVRAILNGTKVVTRRAVKPQPDKEHSHKLGYIVAGDKKEIGCFGFATNECGGSIHCVKPPYQVNDILYVRETWCKLGKLDEFEQHIEGTDKYYYRADGSNPTPYDYFIICGERRDYPKWHPSIHMPKEAARLFLKVTDVRVEKLRDMKLEDFIDEGIKLTRDQLRDNNTALYTAREIFKELWNSTLGRKGTPDYYAYNYYANPYVWVIEFEVVDKPKE